jgi:hypothetical protein
MAEKFLTRKMKIVKSVRRPFRTELLWLCLPDTTCLANFQLCLRHDSTRIETVAPLLILSSTPPISFIQASVFSIHKVPNAPPQLFIHLPVSILHRVTERLRKLAGHIVIACIKASHFNQLISSRKSNPRYPSMYQPQSCIVSRSDSGY